VLRSHFNNQPRSDLRSGVGPFRSGSTGPAARQRFGLRSCHVEAAKSGPNHFESQFKLFRSRGGTDRILTIYIGPIGPCRRHGPQRRRHRGGVTPESPAIAADASLPPRASGWLCARQARLRAPQGPSCGSSDCDWAAWIAGEWRSRRRRCKHRKQLQTIRAHGTVVVGRFTQIQI
jgi:hypothetical protein